MAENGEARRVLRKLTYPNSVAKTNRNVRKGRLSLEFMRFESCVPPALRADINDRQF